MAKRLFDIVLAAVGLVLASPVLLLSAIAVKLSSPGPVLFKQQRMGKNFEPFPILKVRTMVADAPNRGAQITAGADPRITRVGAVLRKTKLDELPQLWNVLRGDMSFVGPRPEVPKYVELFRDDYRTVLSVRPGITDPASVRFRNESEILGQAADPEAEYVNRILPEKIALAKEYIARSSLGYDLRLLAETFWRVLR
jgi:lipopolysaccharide/colanic/teichoic acid biosynthesis glycosyltransferase